MARRLAFRDNPELQQFVLPDVQPTGRKLGVGSYGSVEELLVKGLVCAGKRLHETLLERDNEGVINVERKYLEECQVTPPITNVAKNAFFFAIINCFTSSSNFVVGDGEDATPSRGAVLGPVLPRGVNAACAGDGADGQQPGRAVGGCTWPSPCPQAIASSRRGARVALPAFS